MRRLERDFRISAYFYHTSRNHGASQQVYTRHNGFYYQRMTLTHSETHENHVSHVMGGQWACPTYIGTSKGLQV